MKRFILPFAAPSSLKAARSLPFTRASFQIGLAFSMILTAAGSMAASTQPEAISRPVSANAAADASPRVAAIPELNLSERKDCWLAADAKEVSEFEKRDAAFSASLTSGKRIAQILPASDDSFRPGARFSEDGGQSWSEPKALPDVLAGAGHTLAWLSDGRIVAAFRGFDARNAASNAAEKPDSWFLWIGNFADLVSASDGIYRLRLGEVPAVDAMGAAEEAPCALEVLEDGTLLAKIFVSEKAAPKSDEAAKNSPKQPPRWLKLTKGRISGLDWEMMQAVHFDEPEVVEGCQPTLTPPPEGAVVLFDGKNLDAFDGVGSWTLGENWMQVGKGSAQTRQKFGSCRLHLEFATPAEVKGSAQQRGNSGIYLMSRYELQIMDSYQNATYPQGQCGAVYTQNPPLKNVCRKPGEWQSYDVEFTAPKFDAEGNVLSPARMTAWQNGVLIQDDFELIGRNFFLHRYLPHAEKESLQIQDHGCPVRFRNIWILEK